ncbi:hypothetical protein FBU59_006708, partial [Linderina macrospora]
NFEVLDIDIGLLSELKLLPKIPIAFLHDLALYDIKRQIDWDMFEVSPDGEMVFKRLEEIFLQFDDGHATDGHFVADRYNVTFPKATVVKAARTLNTGMAIDNYLRGGQRKTLVLYEDPHTIADAKSIINLICQLKELETLVVDCFSMTRGHIRAPDRDEHFANQAGSFRDIDETFRKVPKEIGAKLTRLDIRSSQNAPLWVGSRGIHVREFSTHIEELDKELGN